MSVTVFKGSGLKRPGSGRRILQRDGQREASIGARAVRDTRPAMGRAEHRFLGYRIRLGERVDGWMDVHVLRQRNVLTIGREADLYNHRESELALMNCEMIGPT